MADPRAAAVLAVRFKSVAERRAVEEAAEAEGRTASGWARHTLLQAVPAGVATDPLDAALAEELWGGARAVESDPAAKPGTVRCAAHRRLRCPVCKA